MSNTLSGAAVLATGCPTHGTEALIGYSEEVRCYSLRFDAVEKRFVADWDRPLRLTQRIDPDEAWCGKCDWSGPID